MAVEEPSVVAAASNAARMTRSLGGFRGEATPSVMTAQVHLYDVPDVHEAARTLRGQTDAVIEVANDAIPRMVKRGGGCRDADIDVLDGALGMLRVHLHIDVGDAMGANMVDTVAEAVAPWVQARVGGTIGMRILTNLPLRRLVRVQCAVPEDVLGGPELARGVAMASAVADRDPFRAATHNKGILNGVDAAAVALGQDWRAIEAGAHAWAGLEQGYRPLARWVHEDGVLRGELEMPLAVGTVGGSTSAHPVAAAARELVGVRSARELAVVLAAVGLASNLAALRALAGEGIQQGHMRLHARKDG
jgi:hydroxymethylglutaryl-CoA reductase